MFKDQNLYFNDMIEKINKAKNLLLSGNMTVQEVARILGFENVGYFCKLFKEKTGISPGKYGNI